MIGLVAAYGMVVGIREVMDARGRVKESEVERICRRLKETRPTAVNLFWALRRMRDTYQRFKGQDGPSRCDAAKRQSTCMPRTRSTTAASPATDAELIDDGDTILTHCNAGALATGGYGTALGVIRAACDAGEHFQVDRDRNKALLPGRPAHRMGVEGAGHRGHPCSDNHAGLLRQQGIVDRVIVGADRIAQERRCGEQGRHLHDCPRRPR